MLEFGMDALPVLLTNVWSLYLTLILYLLALAYGEMCHDLDECDHVACSSAYELECLHGECTCTHSTLFWLDYNNQSYWFKLNDPHVSVTVPDV